MAVNGRSDRQPIACKKLGDTLKAWKLSDGTVDFWFPKSQGELDYNPEDNTYTLWAEEWILKEKGLI